MNTDEHRLRYCIPAAGGRPPGTTDLCSSVFICGSIRMSSPPGGPNVCRASIRRSNKAHVVGGGGPRRLSEDGPGMPSIRIDPACGCPAPDGHRRPGRAGSGETGGPGGRRAGRTVGGQDRGRLNARDSYHASFLTLEGGGGPRRPVGFRLLDRFLRSISWRFHNAPSSSVGSLRPETGRVYVRSSVLPALPTSGKLALWSSGS
jgi:hypothetical protein